MELRPLHLKSMKTINAYTVVGGSGLVAVSIELRHYIAKGPPGTCGEGGWQGCSKPCG